MKRNLAAVFVAAALMAAPAQAAITIFTNTAAFDAALGGPITIETFDDAVTLPDFSITPATVTGPNSNIGKIRNGIFTDRVDRDPVRFTTFTFMDAINGFGGNFDLGVNSAGQGLRFTLDPGTLTVQLVGTEVPNNNPGSFFGFVSDARFNIVRIDAGTQQGIFETFRLDNLRFGASAVPEPGTWAMMIIGFGAVGASMRRRGAATASKAQPA